MTKPRAVFLDALSLGPVDLSPLEQHAELVCWPSTAAEQRLERLQGTEIAITNKIKLDRELLQYLPQLRLICAASTGTDQIDKFNARAGLRTLARFPDLDVIRRSRLKKSTLFEMPPSAELEQVQQEYLDLAAKLWAGTDPLPVVPMKDRDLFDFLGFD